MKRKLMSPLDPDKLVDETHPFKKLENVLEKSVEAHTVDKFQKSETMVMEMARPEDRIKTATSTSNR